MNQISKSAEELLKEILEHRDVAGNIDSDYWKIRFENMTYSEDAILRSSFKELRESDMINVRWADNFPYYIVLLAKGISYFEEKANPNEGISRESSYVNNFYGNINGIQIQQGTTNSSQTQSVTGDVELAKALIEIIKKYSDVLEIEYGDGNAIALRKSAESLAELSKTGENHAKIKAIINYIRDLSVNAGGGLIASGIIHLISTMG